MVTYDAHVQTGRAQRRITFVKAKLKKELSWQDVQIGNISATGLLVRAAEPPRVGQTIEIRHRGWCVIGTAVWRTQSRMGVHAAEPIDVGTLMADSGLGFHGKDPIHDIPPASFWKRLRRR